MRGESRFNLTDRYVRLKLRPIKSKMNSPLKFYKLYQFENCLFNSFQWILLTATTVEIEIPIVCTMHDCQNLKHPLD